MQCEKVNAGSFYRYTASRGAVRYVHLSACIRDLQRELLLEECTFSAASHQKHLELTHIHLPTLTYMHLITCNVRKDPARSPLAITAANDMRAGEKQTAFDIFHFDAAFHISLGRRHSGAFYFDQVFFS